MDEKYESKDTKRPVLPTIDSVATRVALWGGALTVLITLFGRVFPYLFVILALLVAAAGCYCWYLSTKHHPWIKKPSTPYDCILITIFSIFFSAHQLTIISLNLTGRLIDVVLSNKSESSPDEFTIFAPLETSALFLVAALVWGSLFVNSLFRVWAATFAEIADQLRDSSDASGKPADVRRKLDQLQNAVGDAEVDSVDDDHPKVTA